MNYTTLFPAYTRDQPKFKALSEAVLTQLQDLQSLVSTINPSFSLSQSQGIHLDAVGASLSIPRPNNLPDEPYRKILQRKLKRNQWNGLNETAFAYVEEGETFCDNANMTVTAATNEAASPEEILPVPIGVKPI